MWPGRHAYLSSDKFQSEEEIEAGVYNLLTTLALELSCLDETFPQGMDALNPSYPLSFPLHGHSLVLPDSPDPFLGQLFVAWPYLVKLS